ncbi:TatD family hydrolase [Flammeovirga kamogawensis]|uniref:TatD family hydrolase n=1 Tax=Flammeovirga kamogawensis TaxID=373891 RepID=A0ABX8H045_9BACT|nr:TatD family hydrolase [Flammeovirga kamogawensis]MBB6459140.1 TatD DNase family protein [Flammeovirga kamogawensis]QWG08707.1 TatD family hydrolase [Flammeovirga kamogawensis]TRX67001.1 hydrolase TatD [Flammeovirga kamogawensis]
MFIYFDAHTHHKSINPNVIGVYNHLLQNNFMLLKSQLNSAGIHPWYIEEVSITDYLDKLKSKISTLDAVGEAGLDRAIKTDIELQKEVFNAQIEVSEEFKKPMIIHCVKAYSDLLALRKQCKCYQPWVIHGYQGNKETANQLIKSGCYLSFGKALMYKRPKLIEAYQSADKSKVLFETDDDDNLLIEEVYKFVCTTFNEEMSSIQQQKLKIAKQLFPKLNQLL